MSRLPYKPACRPPPHDFGSGHVLVGGMHAVRALIETGRARSVLVRAGVREARLTALLDRAHAHGIRIQELATDVFDQQAPLDLNHQGILAEARPQDVQPENALAPWLEPLKNPLLLVLDGVTDPHNFGACLRSAEAFGCAGVIVPKDGSAPLNQVARKTASGAAELIPIFRVTNLARCMRQLQQDGFWVVGAAGEASGSLAQAAHQGPMVVVMGGEGSGLRRLTRETCDSLVSIPMAGRIESLNVSVATGVLLYGIQSLRGQLGHAHPEGVV